MHNAVGSGQNRAYGRRAPAVLDASRPVLDAAGRARRCTVGSMFAGIRSLLGLTPTTSSTAESISPLAQPPFPSGVPANWQGQAYGKRTKARWAYPCIGRWCVDRGDVHPKGSLCQPFRDESIEGPKQWQRMCAACADSSITEQEEAMMEAADELSPVIDGHAIDSHTLLALPPEPLAAAALTVAALTSAALDAPAAAPAPAVAAPAAATAPAAPVAFAVGVAVADPVRPPTTALRSPRSRSTPIWRASR